MFQVPDAARKVNAMGLEGTKYDRKQQILDRTWNSVEIVREEMTGRVIVKSLLHPDLTRAYSTRLLHDEYRRRQGQP
jgi:hypothetical protein